MSAWVGRETSVGEGETHQFEKLALLKEQDGVEMVLFDFPELLLEWREGFPGRCGNVESARVSSRVRVRDAIGLRRESHHQVSAFR